jgi:hypothetical protein
MNVDDLTFRVLQARYFRRRGLRDRPCDADRRSGTPARKAARYIMQFTEEGTCSATDKDRLEKMISQLGVFNWKEPKPFSRSNPQAGAENPGTRSPDQEL